MTRVLYPGNGECLKAAVHGLAFGAFALIGLYSAAAYAVRRESHLAVNAVIAGAICWKEWGAVTEHLDQSRRRDG